MVTPRPCAVSRDVAQEWVRSAHDIWRVLYPLYWETQTTDRPSHQDKVWMEGYNTQDRCFILHFRKGGFPGHWGNGEALIHFT